MKLSYRWIALLVWAIFLVTRLLIWMNPPKEFTQIIYVYMPYAHLWASGELPYLNQWYEYPPLTIPFFYIPHVIDMVTNNHWYHINYSDAYKAILTLTDISIFLMVWGILKKLKISNVGQLVCLTYYSLVTLKAHSFIYDSFDLIFVAGMMAAVAGPILWKKSGKFWAWVGYMAAVAIKYVNGPLGLIQALRERHELKKLIVRILAAGILIWAIPIGFFRSSLLVTLEYHKMRGLQIESFPATIVRSINQWTDSEHVVEVAKAYDIAGPVSQRVAQIFKIVFPLSLLLYIGYAAQILHKQPRDREEPLVLWITFGYLCLFMITSPVLSTPYLLWHIPFAALVPTQTRIQKIKLLLTSAGVIVAGMTYFPNIPIGPLTSHIWIGWLKTIGFGLMFIWTLKELAHYGHRRLAK